MEFSLNFFQLVQAEIDFSLNSSHCISLFCREKDNKTKTSEFVFTVQGRDTN